MAKFNIGGQAVIEGVMMRGPKDVAVAVRKADGTIDVDVHPVNSIQDRHPILKKPLIRGVVVLIESLIMGMKALSYSAQVSGDEDEEMDDKDMALTIVVSVLLAVGLFIAIPTWSVRFLQHWTTNAVTLNLAEGVLRMAIFLAYIAAISSMKDIQRVFQYHGAEHKTIFTYEAGLPLTVENVRVQPRHHPRCGTSFLFVVIFVSILFSSVVFGIWPITNAWLRTLIHLLLLPLVVGVTYEFNRWVGRHVQDSGLAKVLTAPGMWMQNFTTNEPEDGMIECAIRSLELVLPSEKGKDTW